VGPRNTLHSRKMKGAKGGGQERVRENKAEHGPRGFRRQNPKIETEIGADNKIARGKSRKTGKVTGKPLGAKEI